MLDYGNQGVCLNLHLKEHIWVGTIPCKSTATPYNLCATFLVENKLNFFKIYTNTHTHNRTTFSRTRILIYIYTSNAFIHSCRLCVLLSLLLDFKWKFKISLAGNRICENVYIPMYKVSNLVFLNFYNIVTCLIAIYWVYSFF